MKGIRFAEGLKILPLLAPVDTATSAVASSYLDLNLLNWVTFLVIFGNLTSDSTDTVNVKVEASTAGSSNATEGNVAFNYRLSAAVDTDSMGAITAAAAASGVDIPADTGDGKILVIDVDPAVVAATADRRFARVVITPSAGNAICIVGVAAIAEPMYPGNAIPSST